ncbi:MAG: LysM peptidoglycan-binding domain-containing protein, partial [Deltaproteobacteria bacterium]|nr:LysM peptidoglycan-binding domain-containing protein [Deltaproteobacteria bacterium]
RRDPEKSTRAAVKYLKVLYSRFGDWYLAITAYNAGEQKVANAIKKYKTTNYWILQKKRYLKLESRNFVPKLLAAILIGKHPEEYGFTELKFQDPVPLTSVHIPNPTDLKFIAKMAGISLAELKRHNPALRKWCTPPRKNGYWIKIPASNKELFAQNFARNKKNFLTSRTFHKHRIRRGETLYEIARHYNTKVVHIQKMNGIRNPRLIHPGKILLIPIPPFTSS